MRALYVAEVVIVLAALVAVVPVRRYADQQWAEHVRRQRILAMPQVRAVAANFAQVRIVLLDQMTPALVKATAAIAELCKAFDALPRPPWYRRLWNRLTWRWSE